MNRCCKESHENNTIHIKTIDDDIRNPIYLVESTSIDQKLTAMRQLLFVLLFLSFAILNAQELQRRATWQATIGWPDNKTPGAIIKSIDSDSPLKKAGLQTGDKILAVDGRKILDQEDWSAVNYAIRANKETSILIKRANKSITKSVKLKALDYEKHSGIKTIYGQVVSDYGIIQRTIITSPNANNKLPAIFLLSGLSCSTIEGYPGRSNNWAKLINDLVEKSGMVVMRVDKPGVGDSQGDCGQTDFLTELSGYEAAIESLKASELVDTTKIVVFGSSMGSALAPYFANKYQLAGVISEGTFYKTWYEHMLEIERRILSFKGNNESEILRKMNQWYIPLYHGMLINKKSYANVIEEYPALKEANYHGPYHMYGRPMEYYHQLQDFDFAKEWESLKAPIRIRWGTNDWIMSELDNDMIINVLDRNKHADHKLHKYPGLDHWSTIHESELNSFTGKPGIWEDRISQQVIDWANEIVGTY